MTAPVVAGLKCPSSPGGWDAFVLPGSAVKQAVHSTSSSGLGPSEPQQDLLARVVVQPREQIPPMVVPVPMRCHRNETQLQVGHRYGKSCVLEDTHDFVEVVETRKPQLGRDFLIPCRHQRTPRVNAHDREIRPARLQSAKETT